MPAETYLTNLLTPILHQPEALVITHSTDDRGVLLAVDLHPDDMGLVIGRKGETAKAIRNLVRIVGMKNNARVSIKINEPVGGLRHHQAEASEAELSKN